MAGTDGQVQVLPDSTGKKVDTSELTRADGTVVERQRIVIADPDNPASTLGLDRLRAADRMIEISMIEAIEGSVNWASWRSWERQYTTDRRGATSGRGAVR